MNTMIPENYSGLPGAEIYGSAKTFAKTLPTAVKDAFSPSAQAALRETGISFKASGRNRKTQLEQVIKVSDLQ